MAGLEERVQGAHRSWRVTWRDGGKRLQETFLDAKEARGFRALVEASGNRWPHGWTPGIGFGEQTPSSAPRLRDYAEQAIQRRIRATARTRGDYLRDLERHVYRTVVRTSAGRGSMLGDLPLDQITRDDVGEWVQQMQGTAASSKTLANVHATLSSVFKEALDDGLIARNPVRSSLPPRPVVKVEEMQLLSPEQFAAFLGYVAEYYRGFVAFLAGTGLRWSEATALRVGDVDLTNRRTVTVSRAWKRDVDNTFYVGEPKTRRSRRTLGLSVELREILRPLVAGRGTGETLFLTPTGATVAHNNFHYRIWLPAVRAALAAGAIPGPLRIHDLRHVHVSWLIADRIPLPAIQRRLGHESITTTIDRYGHLMPDLDADINASVDRVLRLDSDDS